MFRRYINDFYPLSEYFKEKVLNEEESKSLSERRPKDGGSFLHWYKKLKSDRL